MLLEGDRPFISILPEVETLPNGKKVIIQYMTEMQFSQTYKMIQEAAERGDGFGVDEFLNERAFQTELDGSDCFAITCKETGELLASLMLAVSKFYRGASLVVDPFVIVNPVARGQGLGRFTMEKALDFSKKLGYEAMYVDTFTNNVALIQILKKIGGFQQVGLLPVGGKLKNGEVVGSVIFYRDLSDEGFQP